MDSIKEKKTTHLVVLSILLLVVGVGGVYGVLQREKTPNQQKNEHKESIERRPSTARLWMEYAQEIVRSTKPTPPESSRIYAYVATAYSEVLEKTNSSDQASQVTANVLNGVVPQYEASTTQKVSQLVDGERILSPEAKVIQNALLERVSNDGSSISWNGVRPEGDQYWVGDNPFSPEAGGWERWVIESTDDVTVPPPPPWGGDVHKRGLIEVREHAARRTPEQSAAINFWGGVPGTEAPAGIWQNRLYDETKEYNLSDQEYAKAQMILAQTLADAFLECWKVKFMYWTARPSMDDETISLAMPNPPFPSYVSGHSTISRAAAEVLGNLFPEKRDLWIEDAIEARNSRLWAGIHFPYDNEQGFVLGEKIGKGISTRLRIEALR